MVQKSGIFSSGALGGTAVKIILLIMKIVIIIIDSSEEKTSDFPEKTPDFEA